MPQSTFKKTDALVYQRCSRDTSARIWVLQAGSRVVFPKLRDKAVGVFTAIPGNETVLLKRNTLLRVAGDDEGSLPTT